MQLAEIAGRLLQTKMECVIIQLCRSYEKKETQGKERKGNRMKKLIWIMALLLCLCCTACDNSVETSLIEDTQESVETISQKEETTVPVVEEVDATVLDFQEIILSLDNTTSLDTTSLYFTEVLGIRKKWENSLPSIVGFSYPYVYYELSSSNVEGNTEDIASEYGGTTAIGRYSMETGETIELIIDDRHAWSEESRLFLDCDHAVYTYHTCSGNMKALVLDFAEQTIEQILQKPAYNVFSYVKHISSDTIAIFMYESPNPDEERIAQQVIYTYNLETNSLEEIYRGKPIGGYEENSTSTKDIFAIDTYKGNIYLLLQQYENNRMQYYLRLMDDETGAVIEEVKLDALFDYDALGNSVDSMVVRGDFIFLHFFHYGYDEITTPRFAFLKKTDDGYALLDLQDITPTSSLGKCDAVPYVYFGISGNDNTIYAVNYETGEAYTITLPWEEVTNATVDASGNILVVVREDDVDHWVLIPAKNVPLAK